MMPCIRERVPQELGIPADLKADPMTAVASGAAIFCESREWSEDATRRKATRGVARGEDELALRYDFPARTSDDRARVRISSEAGAALAGTEFQIDSTTGWTSGRKGVEDGLVLEIPLGELGENSFRVTVFDSTGRPITKATTTLSIVRTYASAAGIPATQTVAVKVRETLTGARNVLEPIIQKGSLLPASGAKSFRSGRDLESGERGHLDFELYQDDGIAEPELNLCIGAFRIEGKDLPEGARIRAGDEVIFNWCMSDSGLLSATVELPSVAQSFATPKFYAPQAGHQQFDQESGSQLGQAVLLDARQELEACEDAIGGSGHADLRGVEERIQAQEEVLRQAHDADTTRSVTEAGRRIRQEIARVRLDPHNHGKVLEKRLGELQTEYNRLCRDQAEAGVSDRFDEHGLFVRRALERGDEKGVAEAEAHLDDMESLYWRQLWLDPGYIVALFQRLSGERFLAADKEAYDALLVAGEEALNRNDIDDVRRVILRIWDLQINVGSVDTEMARLASIVRN